MRKLRSWTALGLLGLLLLGLGGAFAISRRGPVAPVQNGPSQPPGTEDEEGLIVEEIRLRGARKVTVRVVARDTGEKLPGAVVDVEFSPGGGGAGDGLELYASRETGSDGVATVPGVPSDVEVRVKARADGFVPTVRHFPADAALPNLVVMELARGLDESAAMCTIRVKNADGQTVPDAIVLVRDPEGVQIGSLKSGEGWLVSSDPAAPDTRAVEAAVLVGTYLGPWEPLVLRRGDTCDIIVDLAPATLRVLVSDSQGVVGGVRVCVAPQGAESLGPTAITAGSTREDGVVEFRSCRGAKVTAWVEDDECVQLADRHQVSVDGENDSLGISVVRMVEFSVKAELASPASAGLVYVKWGDWRPGGSGVGGVDASEAERAKTVARFLKQLPSKVDVEGEATPQIVGRLLPGAYALEVWTDSGEESGLVTLSVSADKTGASVRLLAVHPQELRIQTVGDAVPDTFMCVVIGHRASWDERFAILRALGDLWRIKTTTLRERVGKADAEMLRTGIHKLYGDARLRGQGLPPDVSFVDQQGRLRLRSVEPVTEVTVLWPSSLAARARVGPNGVISIGRQDMRFVTVTVKDAGGDGKSRPRLFLNPVALVESGRREVGYAWKTDEQGVAEVGMFEGEACILHFPDQAQVAVLMTGGTATSYQVQRRSGRVRSRTRPSTGFSFGPFRRGAAARIRPGVSRRPCA